MTIINKIEATGVKGLTFKDELSPLTAITGRNFTGKTARLIALRLALAGGGRDAFALSGGAEMHVKATLSDGTVFERAWKQSKKGAVSCTGTEEKLSNPTLDPRAYFALTPSKRTAYIFEQADLSKSGWTVDSLLKEARAKGFAEEVMGILTPSPSQSKALGIVTIQDVLVAWLDALKEKLSEATAEKTRCEETVMKLTQLKTAENGTSQRIETVRADITKLEEEQKRIAQEIFKANQAVKDWDTQDERRRGVAQKLTVARARLLAIKQENVPLPQKVEDFHDRVIMATRDIETLERQRTAVVEKGMAIKARMGTVDEKAKELKRGIEDLTRHEKCPVCGAAAKDGLLATVARMEKDLAGRLIDAEQFAKDRAELVADLKKLDHDLTAARAHKQDLDAKATANQKAREENARLEADVKARATEIASLEREIKGLEEMGGPAAGERPKAGAEALEARRDAVLKEITSKREAMERLIATKRDLELFAEAKVGGEKAEKIVTGVKEAQKWVAGRQAALIAATISPILEVANRLFSVTGKKLEMQDGAIGYWRGHRFISTDVFSGTEEELAFVGFAAGLASKSDLRLMLLDEFGRLDRETKTKVVEALEVAVKEGVVGQVLLVDVDGALYRGRKDWSVIEA